MKRAKRVIALSALCYVLLYVALSRTSLYINRRDGIRGFFYVPVRASMMRSPALEWVHGAASTFFFPVWVVDHRLLGGPWVASVPLFELDGPTKPVSGPGRDGDPDR